MIHLKVKILQSCLNSMKIKKHIALVGIMGSGKTSIGYKLAKILKSQFKDIDNQISTKTGYTTKELFVYFGEDFLKKIEQITVEEILKNSQNHVIATSDVTILNDKAWQTIKENCLTIWIDTDLGFITKRLRPNQNRPYFEEGIKMRDMLKKLLKERMQLYEQADIKIKIEDTNLKKTLNKLIEGIKNFK